MLPPHGAWVIEAINTRAGMIGKNCDLNEANELPLTVCDSCDWYE